jgi:hypothetical protein
MSCLRRAPTERAFGANSDYFPFLLASQPMVISLDLARKCHGAVSGAFRGQHLPETCSEAYFFWSDHVGIDRRGAKPRVAHPALNEIEPDQARFASWPALRSADNDFCKAGE